MKNFTVLNSREVKKLLEKIKEQYNIKDLKLDYYFFKNKQNRIFLMSKKIRDLDLNNLRINVLGLYFCKIDRNQIRLSIEGSQLIGNKAKSNVVEINEKQLEEWVRGKDIKIKDNLKGFVLVKYKDDFLGSGFYKNGVILNFVPKERRIRV